MSRLLVGESALGLPRGVFAAERIDEGALFERAPVLVVPSEQRELIDQTDLYDYYFDWVDGSAALALGFGSLFNHSYDPSARYEPNKADGTIDFVALRMIEVGEEIFVNYNGDPASQAPLWFETVDPPIPPLRPPGVG